ncbi:hypothetical protein IQ236_16920 [Planktothrix mougeotii LEGE 06226]|uniref:Uncharacterized protein n=2 Tax=Planktothrix mougeotii TaxID=54306 RepID=A0ABR9UGE7_9CYAN|nr:hypothetical protein [Planktothrix mougeotii LEGE 06226]
MYSLHQTIIQLANDVESTPSPKSRDFFRRISIEMKQLEDRGKWYDIKYPLNGEDEREIPDGNGGIILLKFNWRGNPDLNQLHKLSNG